MMKGDEMMMFCIFVLIMNFSFDPADPQWEGGDWGTIFQSQIYIFNLLVGVLICQYFRK
jgi:hypothetical protein